MIRANIDFREEKETPSEEEIAIEKVLYIMPPSDIDATFLKLERTPESRVHLMPASVDNVDGLDVAVIGYLMRDPRGTSLEWLEIVFKNIFNVKRLMPGIIDHHRDDLLFHDCSTTGGASGSPLIEIETACVVGLHAGAERFGFNFAYPIAAVEKAFLNI